MSSKTRFGVHLSFLAVLTATACAAEVGEDELVGSLDVDEAAPALTLQDHIDVCNADPRVQQGLVSLDTCVGADLFFREPFGGNGRTCGSCHPVANNYTIDPTFIATLPASDPLFVAEQVPALAQLEKPQLMRDFGLILENVDDLSNPAVRFAMRSVPHCFSLSTSIAPADNDGTTTPPNERTGWSGDGAPNNGELRDFQTGAIIQHYPKSLNRTPGTDFVLATSDELDRIRVFLGTIGRMNELNLASLTLTDSGAEAGRVKFLDPAARCNGCHNNAGANTAALTNRNFNTGVERARLAQLNMQGIPFDGGFGGGGLTTPNFDANGDGINDSFGNGTFNTPPLIEAADTGPFFHTNAANTIEAAITFYTTSAFASSPAGGGAAVPLTAADIGNIGRFLRVLNAAFNAQVALRRIAADVAIITASGNSSLAVQQQLAAIALAEVDDAIAELGAVRNLNPVARARFTAARGQLMTVTTVPNSNARLAAAQAAQTAVIEANANLTSTPSALTFNIGEGVLMF
jgi:cytochrome c peroxidase